MNAFECIELQNFKDMHNDKYINKDEKNSADPK